MITRRDLTSKGPLQKHYFGRFLAKRDLRQCGQRIGGGCSSAFRIACQIIINACRIEMVKAEFFLELLMRLFAYPARLDSACELLERGVSGKVGEIIFALAGRAMLADNPDLLAGQVLGAHVADALGWTVGNRTRTAAKRSERRPLVPRRQLTVLHRAVSSIACAVIDFGSGMCRCAGGRVRQRGRSSQYRHVGG
ncbi:hypothetical protein X727_33080 [Mesorhizobium sp. L103C119B0]|nr:hypothetical protein X727_33080 [Mesorhizobium sp. L103C119B0]